MKTPPATLRRNKNLANFLNDVVFSALEDGPFIGPDTSPIVRVDKLLDLLVGAEELRREFISSLSRHENMLARGREQFLDHQKKVNGLEVAYYRTLEEINVALKRYRWGASISGTQDRDGPNSKLLDGFCSELTPVASEPGSWAYWEAFIVAELLELLKRPGEIARIRRCTECRNWFYAKRDHQHFCDDSCRRTHAAQNPEFKEKRATYMRETYRPNQKKRDALAKRQAGFSEKSKKGGK